MWPELELETADGNRSAWVARWVHIWKCGARKAVRFHYGQVTMTGCYLDMKKDEFGARIISTDTFNGFALFGEKKEIRAQLSSSNVSGLSSMLSLSDEKGKKRATLSVFGDNVSLDLSDEKRRAGPLWETPTSRLPRRALPSIEPSLHWCYFGKRKGSLVGTLKSNVVRSCRNRQSALKPPVRLRCNAAASEQSMKIRHAAASCFVALVTPSSHSHVTTLSIVRVPQRCS